MEKERYCQSKELARRVLLEYGVRELPVDVAELCRKMGIRVLEKDRAKNWEGVCTVIGSIPYVLLKKDLTVERKRYVLAHELGHLIQGHVGAWGAIEDRPDIPRHIQEREAIAFGLELIIPKEVALSAEVDGIRRMCGVSCAMAVYRKKAIES